MPFTLKRGWWKTNEPKAKAASGARDVRGPAYRAYRMYIQKYPRWEEALFDEHFLKTHAIPLLADAAHQQKELSPHLLARRWAEQFKPAIDVRDEDLETVIEWMEEFLWIFNEKLENEHEPTDNHYVSHGKA